MGVGQQHDTKMKKTRVGQTSSPLQSLLHYDKLYTHRCGVCASKDSLYGSFRPLMRLLEFSGHGIPWFTIPIAALLISYHSKDTNMFNLNLNLLAGMVLDLLVNFIMKGLIRRTRPPLHVDDMIMNISVDNYSFPSGHCTRAALLFYFYSTALSLSLLQEVLLLLWCTAVCVSRVLLGRHYWSDVICGAVIGIIQGIVIQRYWISLDID